MKKVVDVEPLSDHRIRVRFEDGVEGVVDLTRFAGQGVFRLWDEDGAFERVCVGSSGEVEWSPDVAICPDALYLEVTGKTVEELFPGSGEMRLGA